MKKLRFVIFVMLIMLLLCSAARAAQAQHVAVLHAALPQLGGVVPEEEIPVYARHAKTRALVEDQLVAEAARADLDARRSLGARPFDGTPQQGGAQAPVVQRFRDRDVHQLPGGWA